MNTVYLAYAVPGQVGAAVGYDCPQWVRNQRKAISMWTQLACHVMSVGKQCKSASCQLGLGPALPHPSSINAPPWRKDTQELHYACLCTQRGQGVLLIVTKHRREDGLALRTAPRSVMFIGLSRPVSDHIAARIVCLLVYLLCYRYEGA